MINFFSILHDISFIQHQEFLGYSYRSYINLPQKFHME